MNGGDDLRILSVASPLKITERHHFDQIVERHRFLAAQFAEFPVEIAPHRHELFAQTLLLVVASRPEIGAVRGAGNANDPVFAAALAADEPSQSGTRPLAFPLLAVDALTHYFEAPSAAGLGGGGMNP